MIILTAKEWSSFRNVSEYLKCIPNVAILWFLFDDSSCANLYNFIVSLSKFYPPPHIVIIHVGGNYIGVTRTLNLIWELKVKFSKIHIFLPDSVIIFSETILKFAWFNTYSTFLDKIRKRVNSELQKVSLQFLDSLFVTAI